MIAAARDQFLFSLFFFFYVTYEERERQKENKNAVIYQINISNIYGGYVATKVFRGHYIVLYLLA